MTDNEVEHYRATNDSRLAEYSAEVSFSLESYKQLLIVANNSIKYIITVNSGIMIAILAMIGKAFDSDLEITKMFGRSLIPFGLGLILGVISYGSFYLTQYYFDKNADKYNPYHTLSIILVIFCYGLMFYGLFNFVRIFDIL